MTGAFALLRFPKLAFDTLDSSLLRRRALSAAQAAEKATEQSAKEILTARSEALANVVNVTLPRPEHAVEDASELLTARVGDAVLKAILDHWNAERGRWSVSKYARPQEELVLGKASSTSWTERREARKRWAKELQIGWETLIPPQVRLDRTLLPAVADIETVPAGTLVRLGDAPLDVDFEDILDLRRALGYPT
ncbi:hypothetical protein CH272_01450 [Rhodococcus sp. 05-340-1]|nr:MULTISPECIES: hypothetical protein [unclassified Rhodococcus (in: high G+C Gram-positive bacteria)]OZD73652.1 hypothetical protein CH271_00285 [Rhodococcus sp. 05-340-2]OZD85068.1 hypothetical protein CH272_01450 [Rhodococcus sp. 05-340-1]OZE95871.1 hypothetical protein CH302_16990 [Rhodococcus sp. 15-2388-1-1a]OZF32841.1 hypothetical protein CH295_15110 [Rhodococcus sp. 14-2483-1-2]